MYFWIGAVVLQQTENGSDQTGNLLLLSGAWNLLLLAAWVIAIVDGIRRFRAGKTRQLATDAMVVKLVSIPFFTLNFLLLAFLFSATEFSIAILFFSPAVVVVIAVGIGLTYLAMISTSIYLWAAIARLRRERIIGTGLTVLYVIPSFPVTDIAAGVLVFGHSRRRPRLALALLLLSIGALFVAYGISGPLPATSAQVVPLIGPSFYHPSFYLQWVIPVGVGGAVILATAIVCFIRRSTLRLEAQQAATARRTKAKPHVRKCAR